MLIFLLILLIFFYFLKTNIFVSLLISLHKFFFFFLITFKSILTNCINFFLFFIGYIFFFFFDHFFFFFVEFLQNPILLIERLLKILIGNIYLKIKYIFYLNYYYYLFVPKFWTDNVLWQGIIYKYNIWPNDLRIYLFILFILFCIQFTIFFFYLIFLNNTRVLNYLNLIHKRFFFSSCFKSYIFSYILFLKHFFYNLLTSFFNSDNFYLYSKRITNYILYIENYLEFRGLLLKFNNNKKIIKPGRFVGEPFINFFEVKKKTYHFFKLFKSFFNDNLLFYHYYPILLMEYKNILFFRIIVEKFFKKGFLINKIIKQSILNISDNFLNLRNIILPINKKFITVKFNVNFLMFFDFRYSFYKIINLKFIKYLYKNNILFFNYNKDNYK